MLNGNPKSSWRYKSVREQIPAFAGMDRRGRLFHPHPVSNTGQALYPLPSRARGKKDGEQEGFITLYQSLFPPPIPCPFRQQPWTLKIKERPQTLLFSSNPLSIWREGQLVTGREDKKKSNNEKRDRLRIKNPSQWLLIIHLASHLPFVKSLSRTWYGRDKRKIVTLCA